MELIGKTFGDITVISNAGRGRYLTKCNICYCLITLLSSNIPVVSLLNYLLVVYASLNIHRTFEFVVFYLMGIPSTAYYIDKFSLRHYILDCNTTSQQEVDILDYIRSITTKDILTHCKKIYICISRIYYCFPFITYWIMQNIFYFILLIIPLIHYKISRAVGVRFSIIHSILYR